MGLSFIHNPNGLPPSGGVKQGRGGKTSVQSYY